MMGRDMLKRDAIVRDAVRRACKNRRLTAHAFPVNLSVDGLTRLAPCSDWNRAQYSVAKEFCG